MDAASYKRAFDREQLAILCANYSGQISSLDSENAKLRDLVRELYHELDAATQYEAGGSRGVVSEFADAMRDLGIEVDQ